MSPHSLLVLAAPLAALWMQEADQSPQSRQPLVELANLEIVQYQPKHADVYELEELVFEMVGREFFVVERGGYHSDAVANVRVLGSGLILYDEPPQLERMLAALAELDREREEPEAEPEPDPLEVMHYVPRFLSLDSIVVALKSFQREVDDGNHWIDNFSRSRERSLLVVRETAERMREIRGVLERIDVPAPQIVVTCRLVRGEPGDEDAGVPDELVKHLKVLLPQMGFRAAGFSMLQTSVDPGQLYKLGLQDDRGASYELSFAPVAYDEETNSLSVVQCRLEDVDDDRTLFTTATILRGGEYTVLGATGARPLFAIVRIQPVGG